MFVLYLFSFFKAQLIYVNVISLANILGAWPTESRAAVLKLGCMESQGFFRGLLRRSPEGRLKEMAESGLNHAPPHSAKSSPTFLNLLHELRRSDEKGVQCGLWSSLLALSSPPPPLDVGFGASY